MPSQYFNQTMGLLFSARNLDEDDKLWLELLELKRRQLSPHFKTFTLQRLGDFPCLRSETTSQHGIERDVPQIGLNTEYEVNEHGIFGSANFLTRVAYEGTGYQPSTGTCKVPNGYCHFWGLSRSGDWLLVRVDFVGTRGYDGSGYERAIKYVAKTATLPEIVEVCRISLSDIYLALGKAVVAWAKRRQELADQAEQLRLTFAFESAAISAKLNAKPRRKRRRTEK